ncbi:CDP-alcohol phosphatidyltransferase family protein [Thermosediminibacter litoriperuensis]|uniref:Phosphatidylglycerophosphate synthase n=1 Tax=Thermosediminibacter litoriperuensis TaxID=291989 RepID=A0A5S5AFU7_9FIRM|nr:CDP-alcohol phosphatidyltransferase family protein [Thermosediminibacter litoriperuensis]TYP48408.1 phosphatidylglycerophosphate synthase [Thermosediminibacter litoriperuensis]
MLDSGARKFFQPYFTKLARMLVWLELTPDAVTGAAFVIGLFGAAALYLDWRAAALTLLWLSGLADVLDGTVARLTGRCSAFGALMDLIFDRIVEMGYIAVMAARMPETRMASIFLLCSIIFSFSVFLASGALISKKTEKAFYYQPGLAERTETFLVFSLAILLPRSTALIFNIFTAMIVFTGIQRMAEVYRYLKRD